MIYIYVEDEIEGLLLMNNAVNLYMADKDVSVDTFRGIFNLVDHIDGLKINSNDSVYYVYDNIPENTDIPQILYNVKKKIWQSKFKAQIKLLPIVCCEHSVLTAQYIEFFVKKQCIDLILKIKSFKMSNKLTTLTKNEPMFNDLYNRARREQEKKLKSKGITYSQNDIEKAVTVEKLYKKMLAEVFHEETGITDKLGKCWLRECCTRNNRICCISPNSRKISGIEKQQYLVDYTSYIKVLTNISNDEKIKLKSRDALDFSDVNLIKSVQQKVNMANPVFRKNVMLCKQNLECHYDEGYTIGKAIDLCKESNFSMEEIQCAIKDTSYNSK